MVDPTDNISLQNSAAKFPGAHAGIFGTSCFGGSIGCTSPSLSNRDISIALGRLCQVYLYQVDPVCKILHRPSLRKLLQHDSTYLGYPEGHASVIALSSAICYVATCSLSETQCRDMFQTSKAAVVAQYRRACETSLDRADILVTGDITVLQAFVLHLVSSDVPSPSPMLLLHSPRRAQLTNNTPRSGEGPKGRRRSYGR